MKKRAAQTPPVAVSKTYDFVLWLVQKVEHFPRNHRFTIGERLTANGLDLMTLLVEAAYTRDKAALLDVTNVREARCLPISAVAASGLRYGRCDLEQMVS